MFALVDLVECHRPSLTQLIMVFLTFFRPMEFFMLLQLHVGRSIVYIQGKQFIISKIIVFLLLKICFVLANSADPDEMPHYAAFQPGLHRLPKYPFMGFRSTKG